MNYEKYSVLMSVYKNDDPAYFSRAIDSMLNQTVPPDEIVLVKDGPLSCELDETIADYKNKYSDIFSIVSSSENIGLGRALALGLQQCRNELVARMDSDDISDPDRCRSQLLFLSEHPECSVVGSNIAEFNGDIDDVVSYRNVPENHEQICEFMKKRCPMNHMTVMLKKVRGRESRGISTLVL